MDESERNFAAPVEVADRIRCAFPARFVADLVFIMYMDNYRARRDEWMHFERTCRIPYAGIRFVPSPDGREGYYSLPGFRGMCFLDERTTEEYSRRFPCKSFITVPDITDSELPGTPSTIAQDIAMRANGRTTVFMGGTIGPQKNLSAWKKVIERSDQGSWFFVQIGEVIEGILSEEDHAALAWLRSGTATNLLLKESYLKDEREFNAAIVACDIIFAVYRKFAFSSNFLSKGARFERPLVVSDRYLMGHTVQKYGIGLAVDEGNAEEMLAALSGLASNPVSPANFRRFREDHSEATMSEALGRFVDGCLRRKPPEPCSPGRFPQGQRR